MDLKQEAHIRELRARGFGVREIARGIGVAPSTVSRTVSREPDREQILDLISRVEICEKKIALLLEALYLIHGTVGRVGPPYSYKMNNLFEQWPDDYFKRLHREGKV
jgi:hypothetical protein